MNEESQEIYRNLTLSMIKAEDSEEVIKILKDFMGNEQNEELLNTSLVKAVDEASDYFINQEFLPRWSDFFKDLSNDLNQFIENLEQFDNSIVIEYCEFLNDLVS